MSSSNNSRGMTSTKYFDFDWRSDPRRFDHFYDLQTYRIREILIISSAYDDFTIEQDSSYSDMLFKSYQGVFNIAPPRLSRVSNAADAIKAVEENDYDLVITMSRLYGVDPFELGKKLKEIKPDLPIILLLISIADTMALPDNREGVDNVFLYNGDSTIFMAIVKVIEDGMNIERDTQIGKVRVLILVEDSINYYSMFLPMLYREIVLQTKSLLKEGVNANHRMLLVRGRPKILLAKSYEEAVDYYNKYSDYVLGVISDIAYPRDGVKDWNAGVDLVNYLRRKNPYLPICLQSSDYSNIEKSQKLGVTFIYKQARDLLASITRFLQRNLGFGDFVFRNSFGDEIARAANFEDFINIVDNVPDDSVLFHGARNHFSNWLFCRSEFELAYLLKELRTTDFGAPSDLKTFLKEFILTAYLTKGKGLIADYSDDFFEQGISFSKFGDSGSLGGKGRGLAFSGTLFGLDKINEKYSEIKIGIPDTVVITTEFYDEYMQSFDIDQILDPNLTDKETREIFFSKPLPEALRDFVEEFAEEITYPVAVRSSSLLEDSQYHPLAGIYKSFMVPNTEKKAKDRAKYIEMAIKLVYASTFSEAAKSYISTIGQKLEIEKMAVIIQKIAGKNTNGRFYPTFSGVARSHNYYPIPPMKPEDGVAFLAVGHGEIITSGKKVLTFCPKYPKILPTHSSPEQSLNSSQSEFYALDLEEEFNLEKGEEANLTSYNLSIARNEDKILKWLASVFDPQSYSVRDGVHYKGPLIIKFPYILKYSRIPLSEILIELLNKGKEAFGCEIELEFAVNLDYEHEKNHEFYLLQIRPLVVDTLPFDEDLDKYLEHSVMHSNKVLGNGVYENVTDIVAINPHKFNRTKTPEIQMEIKEFNQKLNDKKYFLIGFGRWGTSDRFLGIPVKWHEINNASAIAEVALEDFQIDASSGQHFFLNITSAKKPYFTIEYGRKTSSINWEWIESQEIVEEMEYTTHYRLKEPLTILMNGKKSEGIVVPASKYTKIDELDI